MEQGRDQQYFAVLLKKMGVTLDVERAFDLEQAFDVEQPKEVEQAQRRETEERSAILVCLSATQNLNTGMCPILVATLNLQCR